MASVRDIPTIPGELFAKFQTGFYSDPIDAAFKALGVEFDVSQDFIKYYDPRTVATMTSEWKTVILSPSNPQFLWTG